MLGEVPPNATVVGVPGRIVKIAGQRVNEAELSQALPDPVEDEIAALAARVAALETLLNAPDKRAK